MIRVMLGVKEEIMDKPTGRYVIVLLDVMPRAPGLVPVIHGVYECPSMKHAIDLRNELENEAGFNDVRGIVCQLLQPA